MVAEQPHIERVKLKDLPAMAARFIDGAAPGTFIPITKHRAEALLHNPNADPEDVAMLLATAGERCVGYFGVMAVRLQHEGKLHKVHWLTTWAVAPDFIGKGLGSRLMEEALALDVDLAIVGSKPARRVSAKYAFHEVKPLDYVQIDFRVAGRYNPISLLLRALRKIFSLFRFRLNIDPISRPFERLFEWLFGPFFRPIFFGLALRQSESIDTLRIAKVSKVQGSAADSARTTFFRDIRVVDWMLAHPWVLPAGRSKSETLDYVFSDSRPGFEIFALQLSLPDGQDQGYICFQISEIRGRRTLKVLDYHFVESLAEGSLLALAVKQAKERKALHIEGPAELDSRLSGLGRLLLIKRQRTCQVHSRSADSPMGLAWHQLEQSYVDGDTAFT